MKVYDQAALDRGNARRYQEAEARQLERMDAILAEEARRQRPAMVRCQCNGVIRKGFEQHHHCQFYGRAA